MLICGSQRASESVLVDFVTAEGAGIPPIFTAGRREEEEEQEGEKGKKEYIEKLSEWRNA